MVCCEASSYLTNMGVEIMPFCACIEWRSHGQKLYSLTEGCKQNVLLSVAMQTAIKKFQIKVICYSWMNAFCNNKSDFVINSIGRMYSFGPVRENVVMMNIIIWNQQHVRVSVTFLICSQSRNIRNSLQYLLFSSVIMWLKWCLRNKLTLDLKMSLVKVCMFQMLMSVNVTHH